MRTLLVRGAVAVTLLLAPVACGDDDDDSSGVTDPPPIGNQRTVDTIRVNAVSFEPSALTVRPGRTVVWVNTQPIFHTITPDGHSQWTEASGNAAGEMMRVTFNATGAFNYFCRPHRSAGMTGTITVQP